MSRKTEGIMILLVLATMIMVAMMLRTPVDPKPSNNAHPIQQPENAPPQVVPQEPVKPLTEAEVASLKMHMIGISGTTEFPETKFSPGMFRDDQEWVRKSMTELLPNKTLVYWNITVMASVDKAEQQRALISAREILEYAVGKEGIELPSNLITLRIQSVGVPSTQDKFEFSCIAMQIVIHEGGEFSGINWSHSFSDGYPYPKGRYENVSIGWRQHLGQKSEEETRKAIHQYRSFIPGGESLILGHKWGESMSGSRLSHDYNVKPLDEIRQTKVTIPNPASPANMKLKPCSFRVDFYSTRLEQSEPVGYIGSLRQDICWEIESETLESILPAMLPTMDAYVESQGIKLNMVYQSCHVSVFKRGGKKYFALNTLGMDQKLDHEDLQKYYSQYTWTLQQGDSPATAPLSLQFEPSIDGFQMETVQIHPLDAETKAESFTELIKQLVPRDGEFELELVAPNPETFWWNVIRKN